MNKRTLLIIGFILAVIGFGVLIYFVFVRDLVSPANSNANVNANINTSNVNNTLPNSNSVTITNQIIANQNVNGTIIPSTNANANSLPQIAQGGLTQAKAAVEADALSPQLAADGKTLNYYDKKTGKFYHIDSQGKITELSSQLFPQASSVTWSQQGDKAIIVFPDSSKIVYDFNNKKQFTLPKEWDNIEFSPSGAQLGFKNMSNDANSRWLAVSKSDGTEVQAIEPMGDNAGGVAVNWSPNGQVLATFRQSVNGNSQEVLLIGLNGENFKALETDGRGFQGMWSPTGEQLVYSVYNAATNYNPSLYLVDAQGDNVGANKISIGIMTWPSKCTFSSASPSLYCAVPDSLPEGSGLVPGIAASTQDYIYKINTNTGAKSIVALPTVFGSDRHAISRMILSADESILYFQDSGTGKVYSVQLK